MLVEITVDDTEVYDSLPDFEWEKYQRGFLGILNNAYNQSCNTGTKILGDMSEITDEFDGGSYDEFLSYYYNEWDGHSRRVRAVRRMTENLVSRIEAVGGEITERKARRWAKQYIGSMLVNSYRGFLDEERAIELVADEMGSDWRVADSSQESAGVDGYIEQTTVQVKPASHSSLDINDYDADILIAYEYEDGKFCLRAERKI